MTNTPAPEACDDRETLRGAMNASEPGAPAHVVVVAGSAGSLKPLREVVGELGTALDAAVVIQLHHPPDRPTFLADILGRETRLPVSVAVKGEPLESGRIYIAPPGHHHVALDGGIVQLIALRRELRRAFGANTLFSSAATEYGPRAIGVVLSGANANGAEGVRDIKAAGGLALVQEPGEAEFRVMPRAALAFGADLCAPAKELGRFLAEHCRGRSCARGPGSRKPCSGSEPVDASRAPAEPAMAADPSRVHPDVHR